jgi:hypothetical protein
VKIKSEPSQRPYATATESQYETASEARRIVLLGASNLSMAFPTLVNILQPATGQSVEWVVAKGPGRSYGQDSSFFGKKICGILHSGVWDHLQRNPHVSTDALVTDIGNDIVYGVSVRQVLSWLQETLQRLRSTHANVVMTNLPIGPIRNLGKMRFRLFRSLLFPSCRLGLKEIIDRAEQLHEGLDRLAEDQKVTICKSKNEWYGFDPIHIRRRLQYPVWAEIVGGWTENSALHPSAMSTLLRSLYDRYLRPETWSMFGLARRVEQPSGMFHDGTTFWLY